MGIESIHLVGNMSAGILPATVANAGGTPKLHY